MPRDRDQAAVERANYLRYLAQGRKGYTEDGFASAEPFFGVCVPRASLADATAEQVWDHHERRWAIETYYDWPENGMGLRGLCQRDYCRAQGLAFVCLVASLVRRELADLVGSGGGSPAVPSTRRCSTPAWSRRTSGPGGGDAATARGQSGGCLIP